MKDVAEQMKNMSAGAQRDKLLADLFSSRGGLSMMPIMAQGKSGIERLEEEAKPLVLR